MVARFVGGSFLEFDRLAEIVMHADVADGDVPSPAIEPIDAARSGADLPTERNQDGGGEQSAAENDGESDPQALVCKIGDDASQCSLV